ncbi:MAG: hypothetical protein O7E57_05740 [Gammaproteobacteria bacterium]|nr:hypothetical protein [Gammaproteobacteria bacterium]
MTGAEENSAGAGGVSRRKMGIATGAALSGAAIVLVTLVLPAEYGMDPLGTGAALGLGALAEPGSSTLTSQETPYSVNSVEFTLGPFESVEYKYRIEEGGSMLYSWEATGTLLFDMHSEPDGAPDGYAETFAKERTQGDNGTYIAPFSGIHGWFWENRGTDDVTLKLVSAGFYSGATEFRGGGSVDYEVTGVRDSR